ncbi:hypothetical protein B0H10DRAFT_1810041, partial [Mycena sp. CBHHK59/15]
APSDTKEQIQVLVYVDEAHVLIKDAPANDYDKTYYDTFLSVFESFMNCPVFCVLASTTSLVSYSAPTQRLARSTRAIPDGRPRPPITETPFDCCPDLHGRANVYTVKDVATLQFMSQFGRPWTLLQSVNKLAWDLLHTAMAKPVAQNIFCDPDVSQNGLIAVVDVRLCLQYDTLRSSSRNIIAELVASHMRIAFSAPSHGEFICSGYPSEPMLAEARSFRSLLLRMERQRRWTTTVVIDILQSCMFSGLLNPGEQEAITARVLVTEAYDRAVLHDHSGEMGPLFSQGCSLITFIKELFEAENPAKILDSKPDNIRDGIPFREAFGGALLRFTHFVKAADDHVLCTDAMFAAFVRGMAYICQDGQGSVGFILPVLLDSTALLSEQHMSGIFFKIKRRQRAGDHSITVEQLGFFPKRPAPLVPLRPYCTISMDLGVPTAFQSPSSGKAREKGISEQGTIFDGPNSSAHPTSPARSESAGRVRSTIHARYSFGVQVNCPR